MEGEKERLSYDEKVEKRREQINRIMSPGDTPRGLYDLRAENIPMGAGQAPVTVRSEPKITATFTITQQPGEDGEALGKRINDSLGSVYSKYADQVW